MAQYIRQSDNRVLTGRGGKRSSCVLCQLPLRSFTGAKMAITEIQEYIDYRYLIRCALADGRLQKPKYCSSCGEEKAKINAHHNDYIKPLKVTWLCNRCHIRGHYGLIGDEVAPSQKLPVLNPHDLDNRRTIRIAGKQFNLPVLKKEPWESGGIFFEDDIVDDRKYYEGIEVVWEKLLKTLSYREREIIKLRCGIGDGYTYTFEEVGRIFKVTRERVRQVEAKALRKLKRLFLLSVR